MKMNVIGCSRDYEFHSSTFKLISLDKSVGVEVSFRADTAEVAELLKALCNATPIEINLRWRDTGESILAPSVQSQKT